MYKVNPNLDKFSYKNIQEIEEKTVIIRSGLNISIDEKGNPVDTTRFYESLPLILELAQKAKKLIILGHLGRPDLTKDYSNFSFKNNILKLLTSELSKENLGVMFLENMNGEMRDIIALSKEKVFLFENVRLFEGEESSDSMMRENFGMKLACMADVFVNDSFADYRESASTVDITKFSRENYLGPVFLREVSALSKLSEPMRPYIAVIGGAKLSEKLDALKALAESADKVLVGGAMAYTLLKAKGFSIGNSKFEADKIEVAKEILDNYGSKILLPIDHLTSNEFSKDSEYRYEENQNVSENRIAIDIGWETIKLYKSELAKAEFILWNGPMGVFEWPHSEVGTHEIGLSISQNSQAFKLAGGGDTIAAINKFSLKNFDHVSTGGGAMLAFLAYDTFPTLDVIIKN